MKVFVGQSVPQSTNHSKYPISIYLSFIIIYLFYHFCISRELWLIQIIEPSHGEIVFPREEHSKWLSNNKEYSQKSYSIALLYFFPYLSTLQTQRVGRTYTVDNIYGDFSFFNIVSDETVSIFDSFTLSWKIRSIYLFLLQLGKKCLDIEKVQGIFCFINEYEFVPS